MPFLLMHVACTQVDAGDSASARAIAAALGARAEREFGLYLALAGVWDALGDADQALAWLDRATEAHEPFVNCIAAEGWLEFRNARPHPRFQQVMRTLGLKPHDIAAQRELLRGMV